MRRKILKNRRQKNRKEMPASAGISAYYECSGTAGVPFSDVFAGNTGGRLYEKYYWMR